MVYGEFGKAQFGALFISLIKATVDLRKEWITILND